MSSIDASTLLGAGADGYQIERSLRFNSPDSAYLNRTPASAGNRKTWTWSGWVKRSGLGTTQRLFNAYSGDENNTTEVGFNSSNQIEFSNVISGTQGNGFFGTTSAVFRDTSAWYHIVYAIDTTQSTAAAALKVYVNGVQQTLGGSSYGGGANHNTFVNNTNVHRIGQTAPPNSGYFDGYLTEIHFIDGQALTASSFGETDTITGVWKPKRYSGTYGTNGFYLKFADNSGTTSTTLGKDSSGNGNNWTPNNFSVTAGSGNDSMIDTPTPYADGGNGRGNYCTLNPLYRQYGNITIDQANLRAYISVQGSQQIQYVFGTFGMSSGKWYWELTDAGTAAGYGPWMYTGVATTTYAANNRSISVFSPQTSGPDVYASGPSAVNQVVSIAYDADNRSIWFAINGTWSSGNPATNTSPSFSSMTVATYVPVFGLYSNGIVYDQFDVNFGQRPFSYTVPAGFKALNTQNLPEPSIKKPSSYMDVVLYTGNSTANRSVSGLNFNPDLVWIKTRNAISSNALFDAVRGGGTGKDLVSDSTAAEGSISAYGYLTTFNSDGFNLTGGTNPSNPYGAVNETGRTYVAWCWDESATPGFDIVTFTGNGSAPATISHSLGVAPNMMIVKNRDQTGDWVVYHSSITNSQTGGIFLNLTNAWGVNSTYFNNTAPTASNFQVGSYFTGNAIKYVAYLWSEVAGFSKFGSYTGNGSSDGPFVFCGIRPRWVMIKRTNSTGNWYLYDTARETYNVMFNDLCANLSNTENVTINTDIDVVSNGFKLRGTDGDVNFSGHNYIFAAFAESPFKYSLAR